jgi:pimeloyl-ACP methyl ester carboxylesterase
LRTRVADVVAVLDALGIERAHYMGFSWGARLGFAIGEHAPERVRSLILSGNQPYEWPMDSPLAQGVVRAVAAGREGGMQAFLASWEASIGQPFDEATRAGILDNDPLALDAAFRSAAEEGAISRDLSAWRVPCLIYVGADDPMHDGAARASAEIPNARFISLPGHTHFSADRVADELLPHVFELLRASS